MKTKILSVLRYALSFVFLWAFFDKTFGLGFATTVEKAWINGGSPTYGFLTMGTKGPFAEFFQGLAGIQVTDWLFMVGLLGIGISLLLNKYIKLGAYGGALMMILMYLAALFPENNPIIDDHIIYALVLILLAETTTSNKVH
jgi:thiosulfate dehydrogenase [quinone] large subunit